LQDEALETLKADSAAWILTPVHAFIAQQHRARSLPRSLPLKPELSSRDYCRLLSAFHSGDRKKVKLPSGREALIFKDFDGNVRPTWYFRRANFYVRKLEVKLGFPAILLLILQAEDYGSSASSRTE